MHGYVYSIQRYSHVHLSLRLSLSVCTSRGECDERICVFFKNGRETAESGAGAATPTWYGTECRCVLVRTPFGLFCHIGTVRSRVMALVRPGKCWFYFVVGADGQRSDSSKRAKIRRQHVGSFLNDIVPLTPFILRSVRIENCCRIRSWYPSMRAAAIFSRALCLR